MSRRTREHGLTLLAIVGLVVLAAGVSGYILSQQRVKFPWEDLYEVRAEFASAQAVTPGQGQQVAVAGVKVGEISRVELREGRALVSMSIERTKLERIHADARMLLRPKTGLNDMSVELDPGTREAPVLADGATLPVAQTTPPVNPDEVLAALDTDTRTWLRVILAEGARGLGGRGIDLRRLLKAAQPTLRDARRVTEAVAARRAQLRRLVHNLRLLAAAAAEKDGELARLVRSSAATLGVLAEREGDVRAALDRLPPTLASAQRALTGAQGLAGELGPALSALRPPVRRVPAALDALDPLLAEAAPVLRRDIRPFVREARPVLRDLRPAVADLSAVTPALTRAFDVLNHVVNELAHNPEGPEEGFLFWTAWFFHNANSILTTEDAHGVAWRGQLIASCSTFETLPELNPLFAVLTATPVCPDPVEAE